jgi:hypothetical protein
MKRCFLMEVGAETEVSKQLYSTLHIGVFYVKEISYRLGGKADRRYRSGHYAWTLGAGYV